MAKENRPSLCAFNPASIKGTTLSGISLGYNISVINVGNGSIGITPLSNELTGLSE